MVFIIARKKKKVVRIINNIKKNMKLEFFSFFQNMEFFKFLFKGSVKTNFLNI